MCNDYDLLFIVIEYDVVENVVVLFQRVDIVYPLPKFFKRKLNTVDGLSPNLNTLGVFVVPYVLDTGSLMSDSIENRPVLSDDEPDMGHIIQNNLLTNPVSGRIVNLRRHPRAPSDHIGVFSLLEKRGLRGRHLLNNGAHSCG